MRTKRLFPAAMIMVVGLSVPAWSDALPAEDEQILVFSKPLQGTFLSRDRQRKRISFRHGAHVAPRLSPNGESVLLHLKKGGKMGLWLTDLNGGKLKRICDGDQAEWSVDGQSVIFRRQGRIIEREIASGTESQVDPEHSRDQIKYDARWSPDGSTLAYQDGAHIYLMNVQSQNVTQLTTAAGIQSWPLWSADGTSITYCQSNDPAGPWDIYNVEIANPAQVRRLERDVHRAVDWNGIVAAGGTITPVKGNSLSVNEDKAVLHPHATIDLANDWFRVASMGSGLQLHQTSNSGQTEAAVNFGQAPSILSSNSEEVVLEVHIPNGQVRAPKAILKMLRTRPYLEITPLNIGDEFFINWDTDFVLLPDRFANDMTISASNCAAPEAPLPATPFFLAFPSTGDHLLMVVTAAPHQSSSVVVQGDSIAGIRIMARGEPIFLAILTHDYLWQQFKPTFKPQDQDTNSDLKFPFPAKWRVSVFGDRNHSLMVDGQSFQLRTIDGFSNPENVGLAYLYGRNRNTPLEVITPEDVLRDIVGLEHSARLLDLEGLRNYRTAEPPVPLHQLQSPGAYSSYPNRYSNPQSPQRLAWRKFVRPRAKPFSLLLEFLGGGERGGLNMADLPGVSAAVDNLCDDVLAVLQELDVRIAEYRRFLADLQEACKPERDLDGRTGEFLAAARQQVIDFQINSAEMPPTTELAVMQEHNQKIKGMVGTGGLLGQTTEFETFAENCLTALSQRQDMLDDYRSFAKMIRDWAATVIPLIPPAKDKAEGIRALTQQILRNRHYLEGDWRGERVGEEAGQ